MTETYTMVGTEMSSTVIVGAVIVLAFMCAVNRKRKERLIGPDHIVLVVGLTMALILNLPQEWTIGGLVVAAGILQAFGFRLLKLKWQRVFFHFCTIVAGIAFASVGLALGD